MRRLEMNNRTKKQNWSIAGFVGAAMVPLVLIMILMYLRLFQIEVVYIGMQVILGIGILLVLLMIVTIVFARLDLADPRQALGLPEGTVRALIALILLMVFIICGLWILQLVAFPSVGGATISDDGARLAQQLITTIGTLVVAVAGFYFGSTAVTAAREVTRPSLPLIRSIDPKEGTPGQELPVKVIGKNFRFPKVVRLVRNSNEIIGTDVLSNETEIQCKIKIPSDAQTDSTWDLIVMNEDDGEDRLAEAFVVKSSSS
jgi:hypothetical protein